MAKRSTPEDIQLGNNIRVRRMMLKISQSVLGRKLGLSFQQVQKYEKGANRVGAVRLQEIATALSTTPTELMPKPAGEQPAIKNEFMAAIATDQYAFDLAAAFTQVVGHERRGIVVKMVQALAANSGRVEIAVAVPATQK